MAKKFNLENMETYFKNYIPCDKHREDPITNFCKQQSCFKFLCPQCVQIHCKQYEGHQVQSIKSCVARSSRRLKTAINELQGQMNKNNFRNFKSMDDFIEQIIQSVRVLKKQIIDEVNYTFDNYEKQAKIEMRNRWKQYEQYTNSSQNLNMAIQQLQLLHNNLFLTSHTLQTTKKVNLIDFKSLIQHFKKKTTLLQQLSNQNINISINQIKLKQLKQILPNIINFNKPSQIKEDHAIQYQPPKKYYVPQKVNDNSKQIVLYPGVINTSTAIDKGSLEISSPNTFTKNPFLHFFQTENKNLHVALLDQLEHSQTVWKTIKLSIKFEIPTFHKSIALKNGSIYLIGGSWGPRKLSKIFKFQNQLNSLTEVGNMINARSSHTITAVNDRIYIVGGLSQQGQTLNKCQVFDTQSLKSYRIADVRYGTTNSSLTSINNKYLIKVGGFSQQSNCHYIQKYDIQRNTWQIIDPTIQTLQSDFSLLSTSASIQINDYQLFIFGGYNEQNTNEASELSFIIDWKTNDYLIKDINLKPLPIPQGFWNSGAVIYNKKLYCLQNVADPHSNNCLQDKRNILIFNGRIWKVHEM